MTRNVCSSDGSTVAPQMMRAVGETFDWTTSATRSASEMVMSLPPVTLIKTPWAVDTSTSSRGELIASSIASTARLSPTAWLSPRPIMATPPPFMIVFTSLKSRFTRPGFVMISVRPLMDRIRTSSANLNARFSDCLGTRSSSLSFGIVITVSAASRSLSRPHSALSIRSLPSPRKGNVTSAIVLHPPPPRPMILMFVRILLSISSSSASTRLSSNAGALPSRASTSSSIEFIAPPAEPARSSHPARWARIRRTLFKSCPTNVRRVDKRPCVASSRRSTGERRRRRLPDRGRRLRRRGDHHDPVDDLTNLEGATERTHPGEGFRLSAVKDRDFRLCDPRLAQEEFREGHIDDHLPRQESGAPGDAVLRPPTFHGIFEGGEHRAGCLRELVVIRSEDPFVQLAVFEAQGDLLLERTLAHEPIQELVVHHLLDVRDRGLRSFDRAGEHLFRDPHGLVEVDRGVHEASCDEHSLQGG